MVSSPNGSDDPRRPEVIMVLISQKDSPLGELYPTSVARRSRFDALLESFEVGRAHGLALGQEGCQVGQVEDLRARAHGTLVTFNLTL